MTYNKKQRSYKKGKGASHRRSSSLEGLLRVLPTFILLVSGGVILAVNLGLKSFLFPQNKTELNEKIVEEINTEVEIDTVKKVEFDDEVFTVVEEMPRFPGCEDLDVSIDEKKKCAEKKMLEFIYRNIKYPTINSDTEIEGFVVISFIVDKKGNIVQPKVLRGGEVAEAYIQVVKSMPQWIPGKQRGKLVNVQFNLPVRINWGKH